MKVAPASSVPPTSSTAISATTGARLLGFARVARRAALVLLALVIFVLALELLKAGAAGVRPLLRALHVEGVRGSLGFGWLMACLVLSGSPVAAVALTLLASRTLSVEETLAMIAGSRLGASFVVLLVGAADDWRQGRREKRSAYLGVAALVATASIYVPALILSYVALGRGLFSGLRLPARALSSLLDGTSGPLMAVARAHAPASLLFVAGVAALLASFRLFDRVLPDLQRRDRPIRRAGQVVYRPWFMFGVGLAATALTLSVSVSLSLLVPLAARGYVRRENAWPYILGANITTFLDTLFAGALVGHPDAVRVVALLMGAVALLSLPVVLLFPRPFERVLDRIARRATTDTRALLAFVVALLLIPVLLMVI